MHLPVDIRHSAASKNSENQTSFTMKVRESRERLKLKGTLKFLVCADDVNIIGRKRQYRNE